MPDTNQVQICYEGIDDYIAGNNFTVVDALTAVISLLIMRSMESGISRATLLAHISNQWELNDPDNDHPQRDENMKIKV